MILPRSYFQEEDVFIIGRDLLGKSIFTCLGGQLSGGLITETLAYNGLHQDIYSVAGKFSNMDSGGFIFVDSYGNERIVFNLISGKKGKLGTISIRSFIPTHGEELVLQRCGKARISADITNEPEKVAKALGIKPEHNGLQIPSPGIWFENRDIVIPESDIMTIPSAETDYPGEHFRYFPR